MSNNSAENFGLVEDIELDMVECSLRELDMVECSLNTCVPQCTHLFVYSPVIINDI